MGKLPNNLSLYRLAVGGCAINKKCVSHSQDSESTRIVSLCHFLIEKNAKYSQRAGDNNFCWTVDHFGQFTIWTVYQQLAQVENQWLCYKRKM